MDARTNGIQWHIMNFMLCRWINDPNGTKNVNEICIKSHNNFTFQNVQATNRTSVVCCLFRKSNIEEERSQSPTEWMIIELACFSCIFCTKNANTYSVWCKKSERIASRCITAKMFYLWAENCSSIAIRELEEFEFIAIAHTKYETISRLIRFYHIRFAMCAFCMLCNHSKMHKVIQNCCSIKFNETKTKTKKKKVFKCPNGNATIALI